MNQDKSAKTAKDTIYVDVEDEITDIIGKVEGSGHKIVALVLPKRPAVLQSIVNMRLLKRSADQADKKTVLITNEPTVLSLAGAAGVHVAKNLQSQPFIPASPVPAVADAKEDAAKELIGDEAPSAVKSPNHTSAGQSAEPEDESETIQLADDEPLGSTEPEPKAKESKTKDKKLKVPNFDSFRKRMFLIIAGLILLIVIFFLAAKILPRATITIKESATPISANFDLTTSDSAQTVDVAKAIVPAAAKTADQTASQQVPATGQQNNGQKATGSVSMTATECAPSIGQPSSVPAGTGLSAGGLTYITQATTTFSASGIGSGSCVTYSATSSTDIAAQSGGSNYNKGSGTSFSVSGRPDVSASGSASGGTDNVVTVVTQADVDKAKQVITTQSSDDFSKNFKKKLGDDGYYLIDPTFKLSDPATTASPNVGQPASNVSVTVKITYSVLAVKKDDLKKIVADRLNKQIDTSKQQILDSDLLTNLSLNLQSQSSPANAKLAATVNASTTPLIDTDAIKRQSGGQKSGQIRDSVGALNGVKQVDVKLSPFWVSKAPNSPGKIRIILEKADQ